MALVAFLVVVLWGASGALADQPGLISEYAGNQGYGPPVLGPAANSPLGYLNGEAIDSAGDLYIADIANSEVEKVTPSGTLSVVAGTGTQGPPTPGTATHSALNRPQAVAVDPAGNIYIADSGNNRVEKVTPAGVLSVIAGDGSSSAPTPGPATQSAVGYLNGVAADAAGNVYLADGANNEIEKVTPSGNLSVIAGTGAQGTPTVGLAANSALNNASGVAVNSTGDLYIADTGNNEIEEVTPAGMLSVIAGTGIQGTPTPGPALESAMDRPYGMAFDSSGDLYVADTYNSEIEKINPAGVLSVIAGDGATGGATYGGAATSSMLYYPMGVAVDSEGDVYIADTDHFTIDLVIPTPSNSTAPQITDTSTTVGQALSASAGVWAPIPTGYAYEWQSCDSAGGACTAISGATASSYTLTAAQVAHTIRVLVTAGNSSGTGSAISAPSAAVVEPVTTTPTITTPTSSTPTSPTPKSPTISTPTPSSTPTIPDSSATSNSPSANGPILTTATTAPTTPRAQTTATAQSGPTVQSGLLTRPEPTGELAGPRLGLVTLGMSRAHSVGLYPDSSSHHLLYEEFFALEGGKIRVGYASQKLLMTLTPAERGEFQGRVVLALTANPFYSLNDVRPGESMRTAAKKLDAGTLYHVGLNDWYMAPDGTTTVVLKVRNGIVEEIGIASGELTDTHEAQRTLITSFY